MAEIQIYGKLHNNTTDGVIAGAEQVYDDTQGLMQDEINAKAMAKADLASPTFTGTPKAPTATEGTSTTQIATTVSPQGGVGPIGPMCRMGQIGLIGLIGRMGGVGHIFLTFNF